MYTTVVGKTFLAEYNRRNSTALSPKDFFDQELFPKLFDHEQYLIWIQNSPFVQGLGKKKSFFTPVERREKLDKLHEKIQRGDRDASIAIGFPAAETKEFATTSGLVSDILFSVNHEDVYASWIGGALSAGVAGGYELLFNDPQVNYTIYEGWHHYRRYLNDDTLSGKLPPHKLTTWNGQWLTYRYGKNYSDDFDFNSFVREDVFFIKDSEIQINTISWSKLFFSLSNQFPYEKLIAFVFARGQMNKTIGFIPFQLSKGKYLKDIYQKLFGKETFMKHTSSFENLFGLHIKRACELGSIGLQALEPKNLRNYYGSNSNLKLTKPTIAPKAKESYEDFEKRRSKLLAKDEQSLITFYTYKTWLIAMLSKNKTEISDYTQDIAKALVKYREGARKMDRKNLLEKKMFATKQKNTFLESLIEIISDKEVDLETIEKIKGLRDRIHLMSREDFSYFLLLLKFDYEYEHRKTEK